MEGPAFQESGDENLDCWWQWVCSINVVVSEGKEVKDDLQVSRFGNAWQVVPATEAANIGQMTRGHGECDTPLT